MSEANSAARPELEKVKSAAQHFGASESYFYKLPRNTPGLYFLGRNRRVHLEEFKAWARDQAIRRAAEPKRPRRRKVAPKTANTATKGAA